MAAAMPANFLGGIVSPKKTTPPLRMSTVLMWPTCGQAGRQVGGWMAAAAVVVSMQGSAGQGVRVHTNDGKLPAPALKPLPSKENSTPHSPRPAHTHPTATLTTLYVRLLVAPMTKKVDRLTSRPSTELTAIAATLPGVKV